MGISKNNGIPKSSILIGFSIINHPVWGTPIFWKHPYIEILPRKLLATWNGKNITPFGSRKGKSSKASFLGLYVNFRGCRT